MTKIQLDPLDHAAPVDFFVRSLGPLPQTDEKKIANRPIVTMRQCTKKQTL